MTAVEWLVVELIKPEANINAFKIIQQALEMEKQQIIDAYIEGYSIPEYLADAVQYYDITYKTDNP